MAESKRIYSDIRSVNLNKIKPSGFVNETKLELAISKLSAIKKIVDELLDIRDTTELPANIQEKINQFNRDLISLIARIEKVETGSSDVVARGKDMVIQNIESYYTNCFNIESRESTKLFDYYAIAKSFVKPNNESLDEIQNIKEALIIKIKEAEEQINNLKNNENLKALESNKAKSDIILEELQKKTTEKTVSDYALVYGEQAEDYKKLAEKWLKAGVIISIGFILLITLLASINFLPTEIKNGNIVTGYNISNIITKALIIAVIIFVMSFSFKQYTVNRHLQALSTQRQKALNSYKLFIASISADDINSRNALMVQVAKAIYEPQSTGFLSEKGQNVNSGIIELTKIIGQTKA